MGRDPKSLGETARSSSKARMSVKSSALVLYIGKGDSRKILEHDVDAYEQKKKKCKTHSTSENRKPIQARGPPLNDNKFAQTPGTAETAFGIFTQRSGLEKRNRSDNQLRTKLRAKPT